MPSEVSSKRRGNLPRLKAPGQNCERSRKQTSNIYPLTCSKQRHLNPLNLSVRQPGSLAHGTSYGLRRRPKEASKHRPGNKEGKARPGPDGPQQHRTGNAEPPHPKPPPRQHSLTHPTAAPSPRGPRPTAQLYWLPLQHSTGARRTARGMTS